MNPDSTLPSRRATSPRPSRRRGERAAVLAPLGIALAATAAGTPNDVLAPLWIGALASTVLTSLALALLAGLRRGDWSAFRTYRHAEDREEEMDLDTRTGGYAWMRDVLEHGNLQDLADVNPDDH